MHYGLGGNGEYRRNFKAPFPDLGWTGDINPALLIRRLG